MPDDLALFRSALLSTILWEVLFALHFALMAGGMQLDKEGTLLEKGSTRESVLDSLVGTILSQNTTDVNSHRAFASLKAAFPTWEDVLASPTHSPMSVISPSARFTSTEALFGEPDSSR